MVTRKEDWQAAYGRPNASFDARVEQTLAHLEEERPVKKMTLRMAILVLALLLAATGMVCAASMGWNIGDYFDNVYESNSVNAPEGFNSGFAQNLSQRVGDVVFTLRDAYVDDTSLNAIVAFARTDGKPALFLAADLGLDDTMENLMRDGRTAEGTIGQYAADNGLPVYRVGTWFEQGSRADGCMDIWMEPDGTTAVYVGATEVEARDGAAAFTWHVQVMDEQRGEKASDALEITLEAEPVKAWEIAVNQRVEGLPLRVDTLYLREGRMGLHVDIAFSIIPGEATEAELALIREGIWLEIIDPETGNRLPGGATTGGGMDVTNAEETAFLQTGDSLSTDFTGDTLSLRAYDCWEKTRYGTIQVKIK